MRQRLHPKLRKEQILNAAIEIAKEKGFKALRRDDIAEKASCATGQVNKIFGNMAQLNSAVMRQTVNLLKKDVRPSSNIGLLKILAQGLIDGNAQAQKAPPEIKKEALDTIIL